MTPRIRTPEEYYRAVDTQVADRLVRDLGIARATEHCREKSWLPIFDAILRIGRPTTEAGSQ